MYTPLENAPQGSPAWHAARSKHFCASEAAAALGLSKYSTRDELLRQKATGITEEVGAAKQRIFDAGHDAEALARPIAEGIAGTEFYPVVGTREVEGMALLASFDGIDVLDDLIWENKLLNQSLLQQVQAGDLEPHYWLQLEHQLLVSGASRALFTTSDGTPEGTHPLWYESKPERRAQLIAGWRQFAADLAAWVPPEAKPAPVVAKTVGSLPVVFDMRVEGKLVACNLDQYKPAALAYIAAINTELATDQDFADADADAKFCRDSADKLELAIEQAMGHMGDINTALNTVRDIAAAFDAKGLALEKLVKAQKDSIKLSEVHRGQSELAEHIAQLNAAMPANYMPAVPADFANAVKNKRTVDSLRGAVNDELARAKIAASEIATRIHANLKTLDASGLVVHDAAALVLKAPDDLAFLIAVRKLDEETRLNAERERIRAEEAEKLQRQQDEAARKAAESAQNQAVAPAFIAPAAIKTDADVVDAEIVARAPESVVQLFRAAPAPAERTGTPTLKLGTIADRLGFALTADFLKGLGFEPAATERRSCLFHEADFGLICAALVRHIEALQSKAAA
ncbi:YqaJ viral recombinase family protein [Acidovorax sp. RAC01]|uniref:YqaJ viral recombinase family protein n=1 Tax=Acidovorax sp. RAC01 TaxID=1842533 RepID=UPI00083E700B|nr:YqaJ viral recombinase family protein [Acidovorax sp. RAC01]AOG22139.1 yqaJ-like viral recombinase domain protein [Acidovorax sp. RAC01]